MLKMNTDMMLRDNGFAEYMEQVYTMVEIFDIIRMGELEYDYIEYLKNATLANIELLLAFGAIEICDLTSDSSVDPDLNPNVLVDEAVAEVIEIIMEAEEAGMSQQNLAKLITMVFNKEK